MIVRTRLSQLMLSMVLCLGVLSGNVGWAAETESEPALIFLPSGVPLRLLPEVPGSYTPPVQTPPPPEDTWVGPPSSLDAGDPSVYSPLFSQLHLKAGELNDALSIYHYVRNNYHYAPYHGTRQSILTTFFAGQGNDVDLATLLITMLRSRNLQARYASGVIHLGYEDLSQWLGIKDSQKAYELLRDTLGETQLVTINSEKIGLVHTWVQVRLPTDPNADADTNCRQTPHLCSWVNWDPSFKHVTTTPSLGLTDVESVYDLNPSLLDIESYYQAFTQDAFTHPEHNPLDIYEARIQQYLEPDYPGMSADEVQAEKRIVPESSTNPIVDFPYFIAEQKHYETLAEHDAAFPDLPWAKFVTLQIRKVQNDGTAGELILNQPLLRSYLSWESLTFQIRLGCNGTCVAFHFQVGNKTWTTEFEQPKLHFDSEMYFDIVVDNALNQYEHQRYDIRRYKRAVTIGDYHLAFGGYDASWQKVERATQQLEALYEQESLQVNDQGELYWDGNRNQAQDANEGKPNATVLDFLNQRMLGLVGQLYLVQMREARDRLDALHQFTTSVETEVVWLGAIQEMSNYLNNIIQQKPGGWVMDVSGLNYGPVVYNGNTEPSRDYHLELLQHIQSALSHEAWQDVTGYDSVSFVRGAQTALAQDGEWVEIDNRQDLTESWKALGFSETPPSTYSSWYELYTFGTDLRLTLPAEGASSFDIFWPRIIPPVNSWRSQGLEYTAEIGNRLLGWARLFYYLNQADYYLFQYRNYQSSNPWRAYYYYEDFQYYKSMFYRTCWFPCQLHEPFMKAQYIERNRFFPPVHFLDALTGFDPEDFLYRTTDLPTNALPTEWLQLLRDRLRASMTYEKTYRMVSKAWVSDDVLVFPLMEQGSSPRIEDRQLTVQNGFFSVSGSYVNPGEAIQLESTPPENIADYTVDIPQDFITNPQLELESGWNYLPPSPLLTPQLADAISPEAYFNSGRLWPEPIVFTVWQQQGGEWHVWERGVSLAEMQTQLAQINRWWGTQLHAMQTLDVDQGMWIQTSPHLETGNLRWVWSVDPPEEHNFLYVTQWELSEDGQSSQLEVQTGWNYIPTFPADMPSFEEWSQLAGWDGKAFLVFQLQNGVWKVWVSPSSPPAWHQAYPSSLTELEANEGFWVLMLDELPTEASESPLSIAVSFVPVNQAPARRGFVHDPLPRLGHGPASRLVSLGGALVRANASADDVDASAQARTLRQLQNGLRALKKPTSRTSRVSRQQTIDQVRQALEQLKQPSTNQRQRRIGQPTTTAPLTITEAVIATQAEEKTREITQGIEALLEGDLTQQSAELEQWIQRLEPQPVITDKFRPARPILMQRREAPRRSPDE